ncbi:MAG: Xaa-Pro peptidase family protein [Acidimicrobiales bacterium]|nr:Xaa-Pro peptidase family protein [Acidimicrobiales bacterium]
MFGEAASRPATIGGEAIPDEPDLGRLRHERSARLRHQLNSAGIDALLVLGTSNVQYVTGAAMPSVDASRACLLRPVALVTAGDRAPHLFTPYPDGAAGRLPTDHIHPPLLVDLDEAAPAIAATLAEHIDATASLATDEVTPPLLAALGDREPANGASVLHSARLRKTVDELACTRASQRINERAMAEVHKHLHAGVRQRELTARFVGRVFDHGASGVGIDTIWQVMPTHRSAGPWTVHGDVAYPTPPGDRVLEAGDVLWVDSGILYEGYASDFGRTWIVDQEPTEEQQSQFDRWAAVMRGALAAVRPGATGADVCAAARNADPTSLDAGTSPWLDHFYVGHGVGVDPAEMPLLGTDLGPEFDASVVLTPGMVLVLEPVIWQDGIGGYRSEDIVVVTDDGWFPLSDHTYAPFTEPA